MTAAATPAMPAAGGGSDSLSHVRNKIVRARLAGRVRREKRRAKGARRRKRQREEAAAGGEDEEEQQQQAAKVPRTIESMREYDADTGPPLSPTALQDLHDEFSAVLEGTVRPTVLITTAMRPSAVSTTFCRELLPVIPGLVYYERAGTSIAQVLSFARERAYSDVLVVQEDRRRLTQLTHAHLPGGPTAIYKLSSFVKSKDIPGHGRPTKHLPEVILNRFTTALGVRASRMLAALFPHNPNFMGRQVVTLHNQRDFIFFRFHRYIFNPKTRGGARLQELGPRFTLKLRAIQKGTFAHPDTATYEWKWQAKKEVNRRKFFL